MNTKRSWLVRKIILGTVGALVFCSTFALADGETRPASKQEKDFYRHVMKTVEKALPQAPKGWDTVRQSKFQELKYVAADSGVKGKESPFRIDYYVEWRDSKRKSEAEEKIEQAIGQQYESQQSSASNANQEKLLTQYEKLANDLGKAIEAGDMKKAEKIQAEMEKVAAKLNSGSESNDDERNKLIESMSPRDVEAGITVTINTFYREFYGQLKKETPLGNYPVHRSEGQYTPEWGWKEGYTFVQMGTGWKVQRKGDYTIFQAMPKAGAPGTKVQTIEVMIQADAKRVQMLMKQIDWEALKNLISN